MAVRQYMLIEYSQVERVLVKLPNVFFSLETHVDSMCILVDIFIQDTPYKCDRTYKATF